MRWTRSATATRSRFSIAPSTRRSSRTPSQGKRIVRYWNDIAPSGDHDLTRWLLGSATNVFCSPIHAERFPWWNGNQQNFHLIPPPVDYRPFREAARKETEKQGTVSVAAWRGWGKVPHLVYRWAERTGTEVHFAGGGQLAPKDSKQVLYTDMPYFLAGFERFVYLPTQLEPFCRLVAEADAAGCEVVANRLVGALYWLEHDRAALETATDDFWKLVTG